MPLSFYQRDVHGLGLARFERERWREIRRIVKRGCPKDASDEVFYDYVDANRLWATRAYNPQPFLRRRAKVKLARARRWSYVLRKDWWRHPAGHIVPRRMFVVHKALL